MAWRAGEMWNGGGGWGPGGGCLVLTPRYIQNKHRWRTVRRELDVGDEIWTAACAFSDATRCQETPERGGLKPRGSRLFGMVGAFLRLANEESSSRHIDHVQVTPRRGGSSNTPTEHSNKTLNTTSTHTDHSLTCRQDQKQKAR